MKTTDFEFRNRFWIFGLIFGTGFWLYALDHVNSVQYLSNVIVGENSPQADLLARCALAFAALLTLLTALLRTWATSYLRSDVMQDHDLRGHCPAFLLKPSIGVSRMVVSSGMHSFRSQQVAAQDLFTMNGIHAARKTAEIAPEMPEKTFR